MEAFEWCLAALAGDTSPLASVCLKSTDLSEGGWVELSTAGVASETVVLELWLRSSGGASLEGLGVGLGAPNYVAVATQPGSGPGGGPGAGPIDVDAYNVLRDESLVLALPAGPGSGPEPTVLRVDMSPGGNVVLAAQLIVSARCGGVRAACAELARRLYNALAQQALARQLDVAPRPRPPPQHVGELFAFLHLERTGGTCVVEAIARSAQVRATHVLAGSATDPTAVIAGHGGLPAQISLLEQVPGRSLAAVRVLAGRFEWGAWEREVGRPRQLQCAVLLRHPVSRVVSYYYDRIFPSSRERFNDLSGERLAFYLDFWRSAHGAVWRDEGLSDAACKALCGVRQFQGLTPAQCPREPPPDAPPCTPELAAARLRRCSVGLTEHWAASMAVLAHHAPWLNTTLTQPCPDSRQGPFPEERHPNTVHPDLRAIVENANRCDMLLYEAALDIVARQAAAAGAAHLLFRVDAPQIEHADRDEPHLLLEL